MGMREESVDFRDPQMHPNAHCAFVPGGISFVSLVGVVGCIGQNPGEKFIYSRRYYPIFSHTMFSNPQGFLIARHFRVFHIMWGDRSP